jgi:hypothetical protein
MIISKQELAQIVKEELTRTLKEAGFGLFDKGTMSMKPSQMTQEDEDLEVQRVLKVVLPPLLKDMDDAWSDIAGNKAREVFEDFLVQNINLYVKTWREEREGLKEAMPLGVGGQQDSAILIAMEATLQAYGESKAIGYAIFKHMRNIIDVLAGEKVREQFEKLITQRLAEEEREGVE